jgi:hypothetical protein
MLEEGLKNEFENAARQDEQAAAARSAEEAEAVRRQNEQMRQKHQQQSQQHDQQQHAANMATGQAARTQSWYTKPIGIYDPIKPIDPRGGGQ